MKLLRTTALTAALMIAAVPSLTSPANAWGLGWGGGWGGPYYGSDRCLAWDGYEYVNLCIPQSSWW